MKIYSAIFLGVVRSLTLSSAAWAAGAPQVTLHVGLSPVGSFEAVNSLVKGTVVPAGAEYRAQDISVETKGFDSQNDLRNEHLRNRYLEVDKFPLAEIKNGIGKNGKFTAVLHWRGKEQPIAGTYKVDGQDFVAQFSVRASDFDIAKISYMGIGAKDEVNVDARMNVMSAPAGAAK